MDSQNSTSNSTPAFNIGRTNNRISSGKMAGISFGRNIRNNQPFTAHPIINNKKDNSSVPQFSFNNNKNDNSSVPQFSFNNNKNDNSSVPQFSFNSNKQNNKMNDNPVLKESNDHDSTGNE